MDKREKEKKVVKFKIGKKNFFFFQIAFSPHNLSTAIKASFPNFARESKSNNYNYKCQHLQKKEIASKRCEKGCANVKDSE